MYAADPHAQLQASVRTAAWEGRAENLWNVPNLSRDDVRRAALAGPFTGVGHAVRTTYRRRAEGSTYNDQRNPESPVILTSQIQNDWLDPPMSGTPGNNCKGAACREELLGDPFSCAYHANTDQQELTSGLLASYVADGWDMAARSVTATTEEIELLAAAFGALRANDDLVNWALCMSWIDADIVARVKLLSIIWDVPAVDWLGLHAPVVIVMVDGGEGNALALYFTHIIWVNRLGTRWGPMLSLWNSGDQAKRACATLQTAAFLLHEMTHLADISLIDLDPTECAQSYMIANAFQWACFRRFTNADADDCCKRAASHHVFGCGRSVYTLDGDCPEAGNSSEAWSDEADEWIEEAVEDVGEFFDDVGEFFGGVFDTTPGTGSPGFDWEMCQICPEVCCGGGPCPHGPEEGAWDSCIEKMAEKSREDYGDFDVRNTL